MENSIVILIDDQEEFKQEFEKRFIEHNIVSQLLYFKNVESFDEALSSIPSESIKFVIFDLCTAPGETESKVFKIQPIISKFYEFHRIIIFIHSAYIHNFDLYSTAGTLFKIEKGATTISEICSKIKLLEESGFYNLFPKGGIIENKFMQQLHSSFRGQFKGDEIIQILNSIQESNKEPSANSSRVEEVFTRIAVKSLYHNLYNETSISPEDSTIEEVNINAIENYYNRISHHPFWTGDIFKLKTKDDFVIIINPRCNIANGNVNHIIFCHILHLDQKLKEFLKEENLRKGLTDNVMSQLIGDRYRFLPRTPKFEGGLIDFNKLMSQNPDNFLSEYELHTSISDDLTNEIVRKCTSYIVRGGVYINETKEAMYYLRNHDGG